MAELSFGVGAKPNLSQPCILCIHRSVAPLHNQAGAPVESQCFKQRQLRPVRSCEKGRCAEHLFRASLSPLFAVLRHSAADTVGLKKGP